MISFDDVMNEIFPSGEGWEDTSKCISLCFGDNFTIHNIVWKSSTKQKIYIMPVEVYCSYVTIESGYSPLPPTMLPEGRFEIIDLCDPDSLDKINEFKESWYKFVREIANNKNNN